MTHSLFILKIYKRSEHELINLEAAQRHDYAWLIIWGEGGVLSCASY